MAGKAVAYDKERVEKELLEALCHLADEILVTDGNGKVVAVTESCRELYGMEPEDVLKTSIQEMEEHGVHYPSITPIIMKEKRRISLLQSSKTGKKMLVTGVPVLDDAGEILRVVLCCRDVTDFLELRDGVGRGAVYLEGVSPERKKLYPLNVVAASPQMQKAMDLIRKVANVDCNVLITGESGAGKEVVAKQLHLQGNRAEGAFIHINCSAIPEQLLESELFGYEAGAFTGADRKGKPGMFELANNGTLFLDEIGDMSLLLQTKILKAIEDKQIWRLGGTKPKGINCRIIAATNANMEELIAQGRFRRDLYYRLNVVSVEVPPLRERREDIAPLTNLFLDVKGKAYQRSVTISDDGMQLLTRYDWPGNARELSNVVERLIILSETERIGAEEIRLALRQEAAKQGLSAEAAFQNAAEETKSLHQMLEDAEEACLKKAMAACTSVEELAEVLELNPATVYRKLKKFHLSFES